MLSPFTFELLSLSFNLLCFELFSADNITAKRPGTGISPMRWDEVLGQVAQKDYEKDELI
jgi:sialic acid synthase SpsE